jgi:hypothetical protein
VWVAFSIPSGSLSLVNYPVYFFFMIFFLFYFPGIKVVIFDHLISTFMNTVFMVFLILCWKECQSVV